MKPVVSSLVALAIAIAPLSAFAAEKNHKPVIAKVTHHKKDKSEKAEKAEKTDKVEKDEKIVRVKNGKKAILKPVVHHASDVDVSGKGHSEPKVERGVSVVPASMTSKNPHLKTVSTKSSDMPKLPNPNASKASKHGAEKGARKASEKKHSDNADDGTNERDEEIAELVARIRAKGAKTGKNEKSDLARDDKSEKAETADKADEKGDKPEASHKAKPGSAHKPVCTKDPVEIIRGPEIDTFELTTCEGAVAPLAVEHLSIAIRPGSAARPTSSASELAKKKGADLATGIKRVDGRLIERLQAVVDHFGKKGTTPKLSIISGYRPMSTGSMHSTGRAIDFRFEGVKNEEVVAFCKTIADTGCGFYPNSSFVHIDVRDPGAGHVSWIDASGPGETPRYVSSWPPPPSATPHAGTHGDSLEKASAPLDRESAPEAVDEHPAETSREVTP